MRSGSRHLALLVALTSACIAVFAIGSGTAAPTTKPYKAVFDAGPVPAGSSSATVNVVVTNLANQQKLGSANVEPQPGFTIVSADVIGVGDVDPTSTPELLKLRNLDIEPLTSRTIEMTVKTPCSSATTDPWKIRAKQSNDFSGPPGNDFFDTGEGNRTTAVTGGCRLEWVTQPTSANPGAVITGTAYTPTAAKVAVKAVDGSGATITSVNSGTVTLLRTAGTSSGGFTNTQATFSNGVATFAELKASDTGVGFKLRADSTGYTSTSESGAFDILSGTLCTTSGCQTPTFTSGASVGQAQTSSNNFVFLGIGSLTGTRCAVSTFESVQGDGAWPIIVTEQRSSLRGELFVTYGMKKTNIAKKYGKTSGEQFIPICAGAKRLAPNAGKTEAVSCENDGGGPWVGKALDEGKFTGATAPAICNTNTNGYWVGILGSFQDYTKGIDPNTNPTVTGWSSDNTYRYFTIRYPSASGSGEYATIPWDGWQFG